MGHVHHVLGFSASPCVVELVSHLLLSFFPSDAHPFRLPSRDFWTARKKHQHLARDREAHREASISHIHADDTHSNNIIGFGVPFLGRL